MFDRTKFAGSLAVACVISASSSSWAAPVLSDTFSYPNGNLVGNGGWTAIGSAPDNTNPIQVVGGAASVPDGAGQDVYKAGVTYPAVGGSLFTSVTINVSETNATQGFNFGLVNNPGSASPVYAVRLFSIASGAGYVLGLSTGNSNTVTFGTSVLSLDTAYQVVIRYDVVNGTNNDVQTLYVNPGTTEPGAASSYLGATVTASAESVFTAVTLRQGTANTGSGQTFDNLNIGTTFADVAAVPEPLAAAATLAGAVPLLRRRRRPA